MPELPEVETVRQTLIPLVRHKTIRDVVVLYSKMIKYPSSDVFSSQLRGQTIEDIQRKGKYLIFILSDFYLISHLRMEGKYRIGGLEAATKHEHVILFFEDASLRYHDTRKFGTMHLYPKTADINQLEPLKRVGPEPIQDTMNEDDLYHKIHHRHRAIKSLLLDQTIVSGLGNIYVDEVLFLSRIHPQTPGNRLTVEDMKRIMMYAKQVLNESIARGGTTIRSFQSSKDVHGRFQNELLIHTKTVCPICHTPIHKIVVGGRGTYHCSSCQHLTKP